MHSKETNNGPVRADNAASHCPVCGHRLCIRKRAEDGKPFIGCDAFPVCRYSEDARVYIGTVPNNGLNLAALDETAEPLHSEAMRYTTSKDGRIRALSRAMLILIDYITYWKQSDDPHAWDALDLACDELKNEARKRERK